MKATFLMKIHSANYPGDHIADSAARAKLSRSPMFEHNGSVYSVEHFMQLYSKNNDDYQKAKLFNWEDLIDGSAWNK